MIKTQDSPFFYDERKIAGNILWIYVNVSVLGWICVHVTLFTFALPFICFYSFKRQRKDPTLNVFLIKVSILKGNYDSTIKPLELAICNSSHCSGLSILKWWFFSHRRNYLKIICCILQISNQLSDKHLKIIKWHYLSDQYFVSMKPINYIHPGLLYGSLVDPTFLQSLTFTTRQFLGLLCDNLIWFLPLYFGYFCWPFPCPRKLSGILFLHLRILKYYLP